MTVIELFKASARTTVQKLWGVEYWLVNNDKYCWKLLQLNPGAQSSLHYHPIKDETFFVLVGDVYLETVSKGGLLLHTLLRPGDFRRLQPGRPHRFRAAFSTAFVLEVSTSHDDKDVVRLEESRRISNESDSTIS